MTEKQLPKLGLVCVTASEEVRFRTVTRRTLSKLSIPEQQTKLRQVYTANLINLAKAIAFCHQEQIQLYRMSSALFPFADEAIGNAILTEFESQLEKIGNEAKRLKIRIVVHPNQYVVLNSDRSEVVSNSIKILTTHAHILDLLKLPCSSWTSINIHGGKGDRAGRLINNIQQLPQNVYSRLTLENDEYTYSSQAIADICQVAKVPMVFDAHHHLVYEHLDSYDHPSVSKMLEIARTTWEQPQWQLVHISNGREHLHDNKHSDLITNMPTSFHNAPWIEIEAKLKEQAISKLRKEWLRSPSLTKA
ncbi:MAG: UV DNA damage repair endonuclease UvsE [Waterburya sp.]